jgi:hypothetical protein
MSVHRPQSPSSCVRALLASVSLALLVGIGGAQAEVDAADVLSARVRLATLYAPIEAAHARLDRAAFDLSALGLELAFEDAEAIVAAVRAAVRYEPYHGVLRGAGGTLASGGGNALDMALLAASLLADAGYEVQIRYARLDDTSARSVLRQAAMPPRPPVPAAGTGPAADGWSAQAVAVLTAEAAQRNRVIQEEVRAAAERLAVLVPPGGAQPEADRLVLDAARDYAWVAYRLHPGAPWEDAHPVFGSTPPELAGLVADGEHEGSVPPGAQHRFRFGAYLERRRGDRFEVVPIMPAWERPVASLFGVPLTYANVPDGLESGVPTDDAEAVRAATALFFPMFRGDVPEGAFAFDLMGNTVPPDAAASPYARLFVTTGRAVASAASALGGLGFGGPAQPVEESVALTGFWFEFTLIEPGGVETTHRRMVVDRRGAEAREQGSVRLLEDVQERAVFNALRGVHTFMLDPGRYGGGFLVDRTLVALLAGRDFADRSLGALGNGAELPAVPAPLIAQEEALAPLTLLAAFAAPPVEDDVVTYRPAPGLVVLSAPADGSATMVDVVANPRWSLRGGDAGPRLDERATRLGGVWETRLEGVGLAGPVGGAMPAMEALAAAATVRVVEPGDVAAALGLALSPEARRAIRDDVAGGYRVVVPDASGADGTAGWWRIDPVTGETLGRGGDGRGLSFVEYLATNQISLALAAGFTGYGVAQCSRIQGTCSRMACIGQNVAIGAAGAGLGFGIARGIEAAGYAGIVALDVLLIVKMDVQLNVATTFIPTYTCSSDR